MSLKNLPPEVQEKIKQMQNMQNQHQIINSQIDIYKSRISEHKSTLKELEGVTDEIKLFKSVGQIMFSSTASTVRKELEDELELAELKLGTLNKQEEKIRQQINELNTYLNQIVSSQNTKQGLDIR